MNYLKSFKLFESKDLNYSDRDVTNKYYGALGWIRYTDVHQDSYIDIEKYFDIDSDHLAWILEDLIDTCDLLYRCSVHDDRGLHLAHEDSNKVADSISIDLTPAKLKSHSANYKTYMRKFSHFPPKETDVLFQSLQGVEDKLNDFHLTIKDEEGKWNLFLNTSQIRLIIKRK